ncbi:MAG TPA: ABC transporter permease subunit [Burkholderiaceae bacterium]|jgi:general L-amino acid transport system permease protein|nr:ABC transporter permease subunit [Burkholderiaceae bacterium]
MSNLAPPTGDAAWRARERARRRREWWTQGTLALLLVALGVGLALNVTANLEARQIRSGFGFLADRAGFDIGETLIRYSAADDYLRAFAVGMLNTLRVALGGIVMATVIGVTVGLMRLSRHPLVAFLGTAHVEVYRNIPLIIQLLAIYLIITELLPDASNAVSLGGAGLLSKSGLQIAVPAHGWAAAVAGLAAGAVAAVAARRALLARLTTLGASAAALAVGAGVALLAWVAVGLATGWSVPHLEGFSVEGGAALTPEFLALWLGLSLFTSASIAEIVRAGAQAVPRGQWDAAMALGLTRGQSISTVIFPQALRLAIPPLASQYMNLTKNSSLAVIIGYPDLVSIGNTSINQNGQALEVILIIMGVYLTLNLAISVLMNAVNARVTRAPQ